MADEEKRLSEETDVSAASDVNPLSERLENPAEERQISAEEDASFEFQLDLGKSLRKSQSIRCTKMRGRSAKNAENPLLRAL